MKVGLVLEGGSRKCMFSAGVLDAILEENLHFSYVAGVLAGRMVRSIFSRRRRDGFTIFCIRARRGKENVPIEFLTEYAKNSTS